MATVLTVLLLAAALVPLWRAGLRAGTWVVGGLALLLGAGGLATRQAGPDVAPADRPLEGAADLPGTPEHGGGYATSASCRKCHPGAFASWHASFHRTMTTVPADGAVVADFDGPTGEGVVVRLDSGTRVLLRREGERLFARFERGRAERRPLPPAAEIVQVTGSHHFQVFWFSPQRGTGRELALLPVCWRIDEARWMPIEAAFLMPPDMALHVEPGAWNRNCLNCHATAPQPRLSMPRSRRDRVVADTVVAEFGISCEACHGPAEDHVAAHASPWTRYAAHLGLVDGAHGVVHPEKIPPERSAEVCGQCHAVSTARRAHYETWRETGYPFRPGDELRDTRLVIEPRGGRDPEMVRQLAREPGLVETTFWSDGVVRVSGREYNGLLESPCFADGEGERKMTCLSCHAMHGDGTRDLDAWRDDQPAYDADGHGLLTDRSCLQCHERYRDPGAVEEHAHHPVGSSGASCVNCHMSHTTYGLLKAIRSHTIESPDVATEVATGRPNACNQCHLDRSLAWSAEHLDTWYGIERPELDEDQRTVAASVLWALKGDAGQRALAAWSFGWDEARAAAAATGVGPGDAAWMVPYLAELARDEYHAVRFIARRSLQQHGGPVAELADRWDFMADGPGRDRFQREVLGLWSGRRASGPPRPGLLLGADGSLDLGTFRRLLALRDRRRVFLGE